MQVKPAVVVALAAVALVSAVTAAMLYLRPAAAPGMGPQVALEKMGELVSLNMNYAEILEFDHKKSVAIFGFDAVHYGGIKVLFVAKGDCTIATDLTHARVRRRLPGAGAAPGPRVVDVALPQPRPLQYRVNHAPRVQGGSYLYAVDNVRMEAVLFDQDGRLAAIDRAMTAAQADVQRACSRAAVIDSARQNAETVLRALFAGGGEQAVFTWDPAPLATAARPRLY